MTRTDTKALAAAIETFESEFPDLTWSLSSSSGHVSTLSKFHNVVASGWEATHAASFEVCARQLRAERARHGIAAQHASLMDAEYGPVRTVR